MKNNKLVINLIVILLIIIMSLVSVFLEHLSKNYYKNQHDNVINTDILYKIGESNYALYHSLTKKREGNKVKPSDYLINENSIIDGKDIEAYKDKIDSDIDYWYESLSSDLKNLEYYAIDKESKKIDKRIKKNIVMLLNKGNRKEDINYLKDYYSFYIAIDYDKNGKETIINFHGVDNIEVLNLKGKKDISNIKNTKFVYAIPKNLAYEDSISQLLNKEDIKLNFTFIIGLVFSVIVFIIMMIIPYRREKEFLGFKFISKNSLEFIFLIILITCAMVFSLTFEVNNNLFNGMDQWTKNIGDSIVIFIEVFTALTVVFLLSLLFKHIIKTGIKDYFKKNTFICKALLYLFNSKIDIKERNIKRILGIVGANFLVISVLCLTGKSGILLAFMYSAFVFYIIYNNLIKIRTNYSKLFKVTNEIANGNLNIQINEDIGVFNDFKEEIEKIQIGLKTAVEKEVKSQKMKTELISNVSHDLKTPLTSIITYIDLLKDENISKEKHKKYLDILDTKSQRLQYLIEDLFEMSKATSGNIALSKVDIDVVSLMKQTLLELDDKIKKSSLVIKNNFSDDKIILKLDSHRTFRVFENLIVNITKYAMKGSRVYINVDNYDDKVDITLRNIAENEINFTSDDITERFIRGDKSRNTEGSGLGLSIAKSFVELQGGTFQVKIDGDLFKVIISFKK